MNAPDMILRSLLAATVLAAGSCRTQEEPPKPPKPAAPAAREPESPAQVTGEIVDAWLATHPVVATEKGEHRYDANWPDLSPQGIAADRERIERGLARLAKAETEAGPVSDDDRIDVDIVKASLELQRFTHNVERPWIRDPLWYTQLIGSGLQSLVSRDFAPLDERATNLAARLEAVPALVEQATANLEPAKTMQPHAKVAIGHLDGMRILLEDTIPKRTETASQPIRDRLAAATNQALTSLQAFQSTIRDKLLPQAQNTWRLGPENFALKLQLTLQSSVPAKELRKVARSEHKRVRKQMAELAGDLAQSLFRASSLRRIRKRNPDAPERAITRAVLDELSKIHVQPDDLRTSIENNLQRLDAFVKDQEIVSLDPSEVLEVIWTPPHEQGVFVAGLASPGPLEAKKAGLPSFYMVQPIPEDWPSEAKESYLREYNDFMLEILSMHEAIPGHFVQLYYGKRDSSKVRRVLQNGPFVEGWAVYAERVMVDAGYSGGAPRAVKRPRGVSKRLWKVANTPQLRAKAIALHGLKFYLRSVTNALLDYGVHAANMSEANAYALMVERSFQQPSEAAGKWIRAQVTSAQLSTYFAGAQAWLTLRNAAQARASEAGTEFDLKVFHDNALAHGAPPPHTLPQLMGWSPSPPPT